MTSSPIDGILECGGPSRRRARRIDHKCKKPSIAGGLLVFKPGDFLLSHTVARAVPSGLRSLTSVFGMGTGGSSSLGSPRNWGHPKGQTLPYGRGSDWPFGLNIDGLNVWKAAPTFFRVCAVVFYGQAERAISNGKLNVLLRLHIRPINVVVFHGPSEGVCPLGDLILRQVSRLYAFSAYPDQTSLPSGATGVTTGSQEVGSSRSSRTKDKPPQISCAHIR